MKIYEWFLNVYWWEKPDWMATMLYHSNYMTVWKRQNYRDRQKMKGQGRVWMIKHEREVLGQWDYSTGHYNGGNKTKCIC